MTGGVTYPHFLRTIFSVVSWSCFSILSILLSVSVSLLYALSISAFSATVPSFLSFFLSIFLLRDLIVFSISHFSFLSLLSCLSRFSLRIRDFTTSFFIGASFFSQETTNRVWAAILLEERMVYIENGIKRIKREKICHIEKIILPSHYIRERRKSKNYKEIWYTSCQLSVFASWSIPPNLSASFREAVFDGLRECFRNL